MPRTPATAAPRVGIAHTNRRGWHTAEPLPRVTRARRERAPRGVILGALLASGTPQVGGEQPGDNTDIHRRYGGGTEKPWPFR